MRIIFKIAHCTIRRCFSEAFKAASVQICFVKCDKFLLFDENASGRSDETIRQVPELDGATQGAVQCHHEHGPQLSK